jgi:hypothetical protein
MTRGCTGSIPACRGGTAKHESHCTKGRPFTSAPSFCFFRYRAIGATQGCSDGSDSPPGLRRGPFVDTIVRAVFRDAPLCRGHYSPAHDQYPDARTQNPSHGLGTGAGQKAAALVSL